MTIQVGATDLLIAPPGIPDSRFRNAVMMLTHANSQGSFALCMNRVTPHTLDHVLEHNTDLDLPCNLPQVPVYWGGPMGTNSLWMIHSADWACEHTVHLTNDWAMTSNIEMFHCLASGDYPRQFRMIMGYASWDSGQLQNELEGRGNWRPEHSWLVARNLGPEWLLEQDPADLWGNVITLSGHQAVDTWL